MLCWTRSEVLSSQPPAHASSFPLTLPAPPRWSPPVKSWVLGSPTIFHPPKLQKRLLLYFTGLPPSQSKTGGGRRGRVVCCWKSNDFPKEEEEEEEELGKDQSCIWIQRSRHQALQEPWTCFLAPDYNTDWLCDLFVSFLTSKLSRLWQVPSPPSLPFPAPVNRLGTGPSSPQPADGNMSSLLWRRPRELFSGQEPSFCLPTHRLSPEHLEPHQLPW